MRPARSATARSIPVMAKPSPRKPETAFQPRHARGLAASGSAARISGASLVTDAWIEPSIDEVGEEIGEHDRDGDQQEDAEEHRIVARQQRREQEMPDA